MIVAWFSGGATSAVACKLALQKYENVEIVYIETGAHHPDLIRFLHDCEKWYGRKITILRSKYKNQFDVMGRLKMIRSPKYAPCTRYLKVRPRQQYEYEHPDITHYVWGFEIGGKEEARAARMVERYPQYGHIFPLIENRLNKASCLALLTQAGIEIPEMYKKGYHNNNCIGCIRGGMGYWNKIRVDYPEIFNKMARLERYVGHHALKECFLDELDPEAGRDEKEILPSCSIFCGFVDFEE